MPTKPHILGASPLRKEGRAKVLGEAKYIDDLSLPGHVVRRDRPLLHRARPHQEHHVLA